MITTNQHTHYLIRHNPPGLLSNESPTLVRAGLGAGRSIGPHHLHVETLPQPLPELREGGYSMIVSITSIAISVSFYMMKSLKSATIPYNRNKTSFIVDPIGYSRRQYLPARYRRCLPIPCH
jgi:hypothetical protein